MVSTNRNTKKSFIDHKKRDVVRLEKRNFRSVAGLRISDWHSIAHKYDKEINK